VRAALDPELPYTSPVKSATGEESMNRYDLSLLFSRTHSERKSVLSVYLNVDQSQRENLNRGFEAKLKKMASSLQKSIIDTAEQGRCAAAIHHVRDFISA
jgi:ABC-type uncharacterized transport system involved in gliding motility auxiliary subunit